MHPDCQNAIDLAAQEAGSNINLSQLLEWPERFVDTTGNTALLGMTLGQLGFSGSDFTPEDLARSLGTVFTQRADGFRVVAITNEVTGVVFFSPFFFDLNADFTDRTVVHEMLHVIFQGGHADIANRVGLRNAQGEPFTTAQEEDARGAMNNWLLAGCPNPSS